MCGIVGVIGRGPVNQLLYDSLLLLQHRGQDAAGIATSNGNHFNMYKAHGLVRDVFRTRNMRSLPAPRVLVRSDTRLQAPLKALKRHSLFTSMRLSVLHLLTMAI